MKNSYESLSAIVDLWWSWVDQCLAAHGSELNLVNWVKDYLLPAVYWQQQVQRTKNPDLRDAYQAAYLKACDCFRNSSLDSQFVSVIEREMVALGNLDGQ